jgi:hypothetical protein
MGSLPNTSLGVLNSGRRSFLWTLASLGLTSSTAAGNAQKPPEGVYRFLTPECEVRMSVESFASSASEGFRFRDNVANRQFCLSAGGNENQDCLAHFSGSIAIATYQFRARILAHPPLHLRENVVTIDHDPRMEPRPPFEKVLAVEKGFSSDIQAFGYNRDDPTAPGSPDQPLTLWCLLRQNLYLNDQPSPFLIVHWKHTFDSIILVDVIPGERTQQLAGE